MNSGHREQGHVSLSIFFAKGAWIPAHVVIVRGGCFFVEAVRRQGGVAADTGVCHVAYGFGHDTKGWGRLYPTHGASKGDGDQLRLVFVFREDDGQPEAISGPQEEAVESIFEVLLVGLRRPAFWVCVAQEPEQSRECEAELHGFGRCMWRGGFID